MADVYDLQVSIGLKVPKGEMDRVKKAVEDSLKSVRAGLGDINVNVREAGGRGAGNIVGMMGKQLAIMGLALDALNKISGFMAKASPALGGVFRMFERAMILFFRPFGDFLAVSLRPLAKQLLEFTRGFRQFTRTGIGGTAVGAVTTGALGGAGIGAGIGALGGPIGAGAGAAIGAAAGLAWTGGSMVGAWLREIMPPEDLMAGLQNAYDIIIGGLTQLGSVGPWLYDEILGGLSNIASAISGFGSWLWGEIVKSIGNIATSIGEFGSWLWGEITSSIGNIYNQIGDFGSWLWTEIINAIGNLGNWIGDFGSWLWSEIETGVGNLSTWLGDFGSWLYDEIIKGIGNLSNWLGGLGKAIYDMIIGSIGGIGDWWANLWGGQYGGVVPGQRGSPQLVVAHGGEELYPAHRRATGISGSNVSINYNIYGTFKSDMDFNSAMARNNREIERTLRRAGL